MKIKHSLFALAAIGGTAAMAFGGSAVSTAFTSQSPTQTVVAKGATTGVDVSGGSFTVSNLVPGETTSAGTVTIKNTSSVSAVATISLSDASVLHNGTSGSPTLSDLMVTLGGHGTLPATDLFGHTYTIGNFGSGVSKSIAVSFALKTGTGNDWNGAIVRDTYTVTMTAGS